MLIVALTVTVSSSALAGTIIGPRSSRTGTIIGTRTGTIIGTRTGNPVTSRTEVPANVDRSQLNQVLLSENLFSLMRLFIESAIF
jgi:uncharacterized membrane protein